MVMKKKGISPVVATALLLVVAVVAVVGFQVWFLNFQSETQASVSSQTPLQGMIDPQQLSSERVLIRSTALNNMNVTVEVEGMAPPCNATVELSGSNVTEVDMPSCNLVSGEAYVVVVIAETGVIERTLIAR